jgi:hypothetical protein
VIELTAKRPDYAGQEAEAAQSAHRTLADWQRSKNQ